eukprot:XP_001609672.1 hypothetical protein [Babesia bovis T2Bo]
MDCYLSGEIKDVTKYLINVDLHMNVLDVPWNKIQTPIDATIAHCVKEGRIICLSYAAAIEANEELLRIIKNDGINIYVINPLWILAPWAVDANAGTERIIYNTLSLVDCDHILLYVSTKESENNAFGIFAQLSMCMEYDKFRCAKRPKMVRNIEMHPLSDIYLPSYPGVASAIPIPQELLSGETLAFMGRTRSFSLYDLIDSIEYLGEENALLEEEEILGPDIHVRKRYVVNRIQYINFASIIHQFNVLLWQPSKKSAFLSNQKCCNSILLSRDIYIEVLIVMNLVVTGPQR